MSQARLQFGRQRRATPGAAVSYQEARLAFGGRSFEDVGERR